MPLIVNTNQKRFRKRASRHAGYVGFGLAEADQSVPDELFGTSLAPSRDNDGKYFCRFRGHELARTKMLEWVGQDILEGNVDSNNNPPCINEMGGATLYLDFDAYKDHIDADWLRRYSQFMLTVLQEMAIEPLSTQTQVVIATTLAADGQFHKFETDMLCCPFCKGCVFQQETSQALHVCRDCFSKWRLTTPDDDGSDGGFEDDDDDYGAESDVDSDAGVDKAAFALVSRGRSAKGKTQVGDVAPAQHLIKGSQPQPVRTKKSKTAAHFHIQGVRASHRTMLQFSHVLRLRSYAFDRRITVEEWDEFLDDGPVRKRQLRLACTCKASVCSTCKGKRSIEEFGEQVQCLRCFGSGRIVDRNKTYQILDTLLLRPPDGSATPKFLATLAAEDPVRFGALWSRHCDDPLFIVRLCSISVPIEGSTLVTIKGEDSIPMDAPNKQPRRGKEAMSKAPNTVQQREWSSSARAAKQFLAPRLHGLVRDTIAAAESRYHDVSVRSAFFTDGRKRCIIVHFDGRGATWCQNKCNQQAAALGYQTERRALKAGAGARQAKKLGKRAEMAARDDPKFGFHASSRAWAMIRNDNGMCSIQFRCFNSKHVEHASSGLVVGCDQWKGGHTAPVPASTAAILFPKQSDEFVEQFTDETTATEANMQTFGDLFSFLKSFGDGVHQRGFIRDTVRYADFHRWNGTLNLWKDTVAPLCSLEMLKYFQASNALRLRGRHQRMREQRAQEEEEQWAREQVEEEEEADMDDVGGSWEVRFNNAQASV